MKHPQTRRMLFLELNFEWTEDMSTCWTTFKKLATPDELNDNDEDLAVPAAAAQAVQPAAAGQLKGAQKKLPAAPALPQQALPTSKKTTGKGNDKGKAVAGHVDAPPTTEEKTKAEFNKLWVDGTRLRLHHDINRVSCTYIYIYTYIKI